MHMGLSHPFLVWEVPKNKSLVLQSLLWASILLSPRHLQFAIPPSEVPDLSIFLRMYRTVFFQVVVFLEITQGIKSLENICQIHISNFHADVLYC